MSFVVIHLNICFFYYNSCINNKQEMAGVLKAFGAIIYNEEAMDMGKMCGVAVGIGLAGALIGLHIYMCMPDREQRHLRRGLTDIVDDLHDIADRMS